MANRQRRIGLSTRWSRPVSNPFPRATRRDGCRCGWVHPLGAPISEIYDVKNGRLPEIASASKAVAAPLGELRHRAPRRYAARRKRSA